MTDRPADADHLAACFAGRALWGDTLPAADAEAWLAAEQEAYAALGSRDRATYRYPYHALNQATLFRHLPAGTRFPRALGFGSAWGDEFLPLVGRLGEITILEPSTAMTSATIGGAPVSYVRPRADGLLPFPDGAFSLVTCLQVLHHLPHVTATTRELARVLAPDGWLLLSEPTISMGDWRTHRPGLTAHERGIPRPLLLAMLADAGLDVVRETRCHFPLTRRLGGWWGGSAFNTRAGVRLDLLLARLFSWNRTYHARHPLAKIRPTASAFVLRHRGAGA